jgi:dihydropyrimidinase
MTAPIKTTAIKGGIVVSGREMKRADVFLSGGRIAGVEPGGSQRTADTVIDASGKFVLPGIIDAHIHPVYADRIDTLSKAAAAEGITTVIAYVGAVKAWGQSGDLMGAIEDFIEEAKNTSMIDFGVHCTLLQNDIHEAAAVIPRLVEKGVISYKAFMAYAKRGMKLEDDELLHLMEVIAANGAILAAHAENGAIIDYLEKRFINAGREAPEHYVTTHPNLSEAEAIFRLLTLASVTQCPIYIPHISARESLDAVRWFKNNGLTEFYTETCPHYLTLSEDEMKSKGALAKMSPPLRSLDDVEKMWQALQDGLIDVIASDTAGHTKSANEPLRDNIFNAPYGIPGIDTLLKVVYSEGVNQGRLTMPRLVAVLSEQPAKIFGLYPRKGAIIEGSDADVVLWDPAIAYTVPERNPLLKVDYSMFAGRKGLGAPILVMQRGRVLMQQGKLQAQAGQAKYLQRSRTDSESAPVPP